MRLVKRVYPFLVSMTNVAQEIAHLRSRDRVFLTRLIGTGLLIAILEQPTSTENGTEKRIETIIGIGMVIERKMIDGIVGGAALGAVAVVVTGIGIEAVIVNATDLVIDTAEKEPEIGIVIANVTEIVTGIAKGTAIAITIVIRITIANAEVVVKEVQSPEETGIREIEETEVVVADEVEVPVSHRESHRPSLIQL